MDRTLRYRAISCVRTGGLLGAEVSPCRSTTGRVENWLLATACREAASWNQGRGSHLRIAVKLGARQCVHAGLAEKVAAVLADCALPPQRLDLEIGGTALRESLPHTLQALSRVRDLGVRLTLDDRCTGYWHLAYLRSLPFQRIKVGTGLVAECAKRGAGSSRLEGILELARALRIVTIAEAVEDRAHLARLSQLGCDEVQGDAFHFFARATSSASSAPLL